MTLLDRPSVNKSDFFVLTVAETSLDMKQSSQRAACVFASRDITRIQSNTTIETHTFTPEPKLILSPLSSYNEKGDDLISHPLVKVRLKNQLPFSTILAIFCSRDEYAVFKVICTSIEWISALDVCYFLLICRCRW